MSFDELSHILDKLSVKEHLTNPPVPLNYQNYIIFYSNLENLKITLK